MKNKKILAITALFLSACVTPTASLATNSLEVDKTGYLFYQNEDHFLRIDELNICNKMLILTLIIFF